MGKPARRWRYVIGATTISVTVLALLGGWNAVVNEATLIAIGVVFPIIEVISLSIVWKLIADQARANGWEL